MAFNFKQAFGNMKPATRQKFVLAMVIGVGASIAAFSNLVGNKTGAPTVTIAPVAPQQLSIDTKLFDKTTKTEIDSNKQEIEKLRAQLEAYNKNPSGATPPLPGQSTVPQPAVPAPAATPAQQPAIPAPVPPPPAQADNSAKNTKKSGKQTASSIKVPPPPPIVPGTSRPGGNQDLQGGSAQPVTRPMESPIGDIEIISVSKGKEAGEVKDKKKEETLYLPTGSFMEATSLNGLYAPTTSGARGNPVPVLIRVKTPSKLPNAVKANLKGCFVIAEAVGNLSDERAHLRLVNLSCISKNGEAVIDQKIKGYVVDFDGFIGLKGRVVSRLGSTIARSLVSGFFGGFGEALKGSTQTSSLTSLGMPVSNPMAGLDKMAIAGAGQGLSDATKQIQQFYLELAKQTVPVIEILPRKKITMIISEGAKLDVKPLQIYK